MVACGGGALLNGVVESNSSSVSSSSLLPPCPPSLSSVQFNIFGKKHSTKPSSRPG
jgi:hypothetical protein